MPSYVISSGHSLKVRGAKGFIDEVIEARNVVDRVVQLLQQSGTTVHKFHDNTSRTQTENIRTIVNFHNSKVRDYDISVHFNAGTKEIGGTEVYYVTENNKVKAAALSKVISQALGIRDRGAKYRDDLGFLNQTDENALLVEICFVDTKSNCDAYVKNFDQLCIAIAETLSGQVLSNLVQTKVVSAQKEEPQLTEKQVIELVEKTIQEKLKFTPSVQAMKDSASTSLLRFQNKETPLDPRWRESLNSGEISLSDLVGLLYVAIDRGYLK